MLSETERAEWARANRVAFEVAPLVEMRDGAKIQVGFTLSLYAGLPMEKPPGKERREAGLALYGQLREFAESLVSADASGPRIEIDPLRSAAFLRPENAMKPEVALTARILHREGYFTAVTAEERAMVGPFEQRLAAMGLKRSRW